MGWPVSYRRPGRDLSRPVRVMQHIIIPMLRMAAGARMRREWVTSACATGGLSAAKIGGLTIHARPWILDAASRSASIL